MPDAVEEFVPVREVEEEFTPVREVQDEFVPVREVSTTPSETEQLGPVARAARAREKAAAMPMSEEQKTTPLLRIPHVPRPTVVEPTMLGEAFRGVQNKVADLVEGATSPQGMAITAGTVLAPELVVPAISVPAIYEGAQETVEGLREGDVAKTTGGLVQTVAGEFGVARPVARIVGAVGGVARAASEWAAVEGPTARELPGVDLQAINALDPRLAREAALERVRAGALPIDHEAVLPGASKTFEEVVGEPASGERATVEEPNASGIEEAATPVRDVLRSDESGTQAPSGVPESVNEGGAGVRGNENQAPSKPEAAIEPRDWDAFYEDLVGDLDAFAPARSSGRRSYEMDDVAERFVEFARKDKTGRPLTELVKDFARQDEASAGQIRKLRVSVKNVEGAAVEPAPAATPTPPEPALFVRHGNKLAQVTPKQASQVFGEIRDQTMAGASTMPSMKLYDGNGNQIGYVSYNGKVWLGRGEEYGPGAQPDRLIYNPDASGAGAGTEPTSLPSGPGLVGMGAALEGERSMGAGEDIFGIAQRVREQMADTGRFPYTPPGEGTNAWESIQRGRQLLRDGADPEEILSNFERTGRFSSDDLSVLRAHMEELYRQARRVEEQHGTTSREWLSAQQKMLDYWERSKPMQTAWHRMGEAQQGATDVDTGDMVSMSQAHMKATGKGFTKQQVQEGEQVTGRVKRARVEENNAQQNAINTIDKETEKKAPGVKPARTLDEARAQFADGAKKDGSPDELTSKQIRTIWQRAKDEYIAKGMANLDDIATGLARDFGLSRDQIKKALTASKGAKRATDEMYVKQARARQLEAAARTWLRDADTPPWLRKLKRVPDFLFAAKTFGHGTVGMVTHAGGLMFDPRTWDVYFGNFKEQYKLAYKDKGAYHQSAMQDLMRRENWAMAKRAGLANDPFRYYDDYQSQQMRLGVGWLLKAGNRGFDILKVLRQDLFDYEWGKVSPAERSPEMAKGLAELVNHATGVVTGDFLGKTLNPAANLMMFAPRLEASRWAWLFKDTERTMSTFGRWAAGKETTPVERMVAMSDAMRKASILGTYMTLLYVNSKLLDKFGSNQEINWTEPGRGDFLAFKAFGHNISVVGPILHLVGYLADVARIAQGNRGKLESLGGRFKETGGRTFEYAGQKLSPFGQLARDVIFQADFKGRPMPYSTDKVPKNLKRQGLEAYTTTEYIRNQLSPIPVEELFKEVWEGQGITEATAKQWFNGLLSFGMTGFTGIRVPEDRRVE